MSVNIVICNTAWSD